MPRQVSLGCGLFGWPAAEGFDEPVEGVPEAWLLNFLERHSNFQVWRGVQLACRAGRDWVEENVHSADFAVKLLGPEQPPPPLQPQQPGDADASDAEASDAESSDSEQPNTSSSNTHICADTFAAMAEQIETVAAQLRDRGMLPSELSIVCDGSPESAAGLAALTTALQGVLPCVDTLLLAAMSLKAVRRPALTTLLQGPAFSNLRSLALSQLTIALPTPSTLPHLHMLALHLRTDSKPRIPYREYPPPPKLLTSVAPYTRQLRYFSIVGYDMHVGHWEELFRHGRGKSRTLRQFNTGADLTPNLVQVLLDFAPKLLSLSVGGCDWQPYYIDDNGELQISEWDTTDYSERVWRVKTLTFTDDPIIEFRYLAELPRRAKGRLHLKFTKPLAPEDSVTRFRDRLAEWRFDAPEIVFKGPWYDKGNRLLYKEHHVVLKETLEPLTQLSAPNAVVQLSGWQWDEACVQTLADMLPKLQHLSFSIRAHTHSQPVTDEQLRQLLPVAVHVQSLHIDCLSLKSDTHANTPWPWDELTIDTLDIADLCKLPDPSAVEEGVWVVCETLTINSDTITKVGKDAMLQRLASVSFSWDTRLEIRLPWCNDPHTQLSVLRALYWDEDKDFKTQVYLQLIGWPLTHDTMQALKGLPEWECGLDLRTCTWAISDPAAYMDLGRCVPTSYLVWCIPRDTPQPVRTALYAGVNAHRAEHKCEGRLSFGTGPSTRYVDVGEHVRVYSDE